MKNKPFSHEADQPLSRDKRPRPPAPVWASMILIVIFLVTFLMSMPDTLKVIAKTPLVTRFFYWVTYGTFYFWPAFTASPATACTLITLPGRGAVTSPDAPPLTIAPPDAR